MKNLKNKAILLLSIIILTGASYGFVKTSDKDFAIVKNLDVFYSLFRELNLFYVDDTDPEKLIETGINSMLASLDPYTVYIPESDMDDFNFMTTGKYGGIGALIRQTDGYAIIAEPYEGSPSVLSGLRAGDQIISVDNFSTKGKALSEVSDRLKGDPDTEVVVVVKKPGKEKEEKVKILRKEIHINNVSYSGMLDQTTGYIRLSNFTFGAGNEVKEAFLNLKEEGAKELILDLRGNPGGLLIESVRICNIFVPKGEMIVSTRGKVKQWDKEHFTTSDPVDTNIPLVVLVNRSSASASEIVAGALQDLDRAVILGQRTFGKGLVQTTRNLKYNSQLKVTTAKYYIPSGRCIQALDYTNRNDDGSVGHIPDSLISEYSTRNGRLVFDGGGISPDLSDTLESISRLSLQLYLKNIFFDFATEYVMQNPEAPQIENFSISDENYNWFIEYVCNKDFHFQTSSEKKLTELIEATKREKYFDISEEEILSLKEKLKHNNHKDLTVFKEEIIRLINEEIISRYYFHKGRIILSIEDDNLIRKSEEILKDHEVVNQLLKGNETPRSKLTSYHNGIFSFPYTSRCGEYYP